MGQILVRNINDAALDRLRKKAKFRGQSLEAAVRQLIEMEAEPDTKAIVAELRAIRAMTPGVLPPLTSDEYREGLE
jgi:antitoxin FitA